MPRFEDGRTWGSMKVSAWNMKSRTPYDQFRKMMRNTALVSSVDLLVSKNLRIEYEGEFCRLFGNSFKTAA